MTLVEQTKSGVPRLDGGTSEVRFPNISSWKVVLGESDSTAQRNLRLLWADDGSSLSVLSDVHEVNGATFVIRFARIAEFLLNYDSRQILISRLGKGVSEHTLRHLLVDQIWPRIIAQSGQLVIHAAGVLIPKGAVLFVGQSGRGKSTLAASLHQRGYALLGDDAMVTSESGGKPRCCAVYRSLRLFPDSITKLFDQPIEQSKVAEYTAKRNVHLPVPERPDEQPVRAIFFIEPDEAQASPLVHRISPAAACIRLVEHSFWLDPTDMGLTARKLHAASALANGVPCYELIYPRDYSKIAELHAEIFSVLD